MKRSKIVVLFACAGLLVSGLGFAEVEKSGEWPDHEKAVSLDATGIPRNEALKKLADQAGWSLVIRAPDEDPVDVHVKDEEPGKVLEVLLDDGHFTASRDGKLVRIAPAAADAPAEDQGTPDAPADAPPAAAPSPRSLAGGEDRSVHGGSLTIGPSEVVHDLKVMGGDVDLEGTVTGNLSVMGGRVHIEKSGHVLGKATTMGGEIDMEDGATVDGRIGSLGGSVKRGGKVISSGYTLDEQDAPKGQPGLLQRIGQSITAAAMLFVFGAVLLALADRKMEVFRVEVAMRPMRSFALGIVGILGGAVTVAALCVTVVGIPVAVVFAILAVFAAYAGICAVLTTAGKALIGHKTDSPYLHLGFGCLLFLVSGAIPYVGGVVTFAVTMMGVGVVVATRAAGTWPSKGRIVQAGPYRTAA